MEEGITDIKIDHLKPKMKTLPSFKYLQIVKGQTVVQVKADGEFTYLAYSREGSYTVNLWGRMRKDFPALNEFNEAMRFRRETSRLERWIYQGRIEEYFMLQPQEKEAVSEARRL